MKAATICYVTKDEKTLMIYHQGKVDNRYNEKWNGLGGKLLAGESPEEGAKREIIEESGLTPLDLLLCGYITFPRMGGGDDDLLCFVYRVDHWTGVPTRSKEGELRWVENGKMLDLPLWEADKIFLPYVYERKLFSGKFVYDKDGKLVNHSIQFM